MKQTLLLALIATIAMSFIISGCSSAIQSQGSSSQGTKEVIQEAKSAAIGQDTATTINDSSNILSGTVSQYRKFSQTEYELALAQNKTIVLNFYANWCPSCRAEQVEAIGAFNSLANPNVIGFQVNFKDSETDASEIDMAKKFGITYQHTKVILVNGAQTLKSGESWSSADYVNYLGNY